MIDPALITLAVALGGIVAGIITAILNYLLQKPKIDSEAISTLQRTIANMQSHSTKQDGVIFDLQKSNVDQQRVITGLMDTSERQNAEIVRQRVELTASREREDQQRETSTQLRAELMDAIKRIDGFPARIQALEKIIETLGGDIKGVAAATALSTTSL